LLCSLLLCLPAHADRTKIGVSLPLTGNSAAFGADIRNFLQFAVNQIAPGEYDLVVEDDQCSGKTAASIAHKFITVDQIRYVLGYGCSGALLPSARLYEQARVLVISAAAASPAVSAAGRFVYRTWPSDAQAAQLLFGYISRHHRHLALVSEQTEYGIGFQKAFLEAAAGSSLKITEAPFLTTDADLRTLVLKLKAAAVDALFINAQSEATFLNLLTQARALGLAAPVYGVYPPSSAKFIAAAGDAAEGIIYADTPAADDLLTPEGRELLQRYLKEYGPINTLPAVFLSAYESVRALHAARRSGQDLRRYLDSTRFQGLFGPWNFDPNGDIQGLGFILKQIRQGRGVPLEN
jgi:branched-chain amino acid transport system substrate-binding protein